MVIVSRYSKGKRTMSTALPTCRVVALVPRLAISKMIAVFAKSLADTFTSANRFRLYARWSIGKFLIRYDFVFESGQDDSS